jgi:hypothetical protein
MAKAAKRNEHLWLVNTREDPHTTFQMLFSNDDAEAATIKAMKWLDRRSEKLQIPARRIKQIRYAGTIDVF